MRTLIFTEGGSQIGLGHISRCSSLYDELEARGIEVEFIIFGDFNDIEIIKNKKYKTINWLSREFLEGYIRDNDYCIVDSYLAEKDLYKVISKSSKKSIYIDDNGRIKYPKGTIVNPSLFTESVKYPVQNTNCYLLGPEYIILRKPFINIQREIIKPKVHEVLITMGGSDVHGLTSIILNHLSSRYPKITFNVVIGTNRYSGDFSQLNLNNIQFHQKLSAEEMVDIMLKSDISITAAGQTVYELMATQTPFIPIKVIGNQDTNIKGLIEYDLVQSVLNHNDNLLLEKLNEQFDKMLNVNLRKELINKYSKVIDGLGSKRIIDSLTGNYFLRKVKEKDIHDVFQLSNEDYVREHSINKKKISWEDHVFWFKKIINSDKHHFYIVTDYTDKFLGQVRFEVENSIATVSISLGKSVAGKGLSTNFLIKSIKFLKSERSDVESIVAIVSEKNIASKKLFEKTGFIFSETKNGLVKYVYFNN